MTRGKSKGRSSLTYRHKLSKLEKQYKNLCKASQKAKEAKKTRSFYFHIKYPTFEKYIETFKIKESTK